MWFLKFILNVLNDKCLNCNERFTSTFCIPDRLSQRKVCGLIVQCLSEDCSWCGKLMEYAQHWNESHVGRSIQ